MNQIELSQILLAVLPALIVGGVAFYFFRSFHKNEEARRRFLLHKENQNTALPLKLQAYERLTLFLERISPGKLLFRIKPNSEDKEAYERALIYAIEQEFEHNLAQQIYLSTESWNYIKTSKNATIALIRKTNQQEEIDTADKLREVILKKLVEKESPTDVAIAYLKTEVKQFI